jgi:hypothetical protein
MKVGYEIIVSNYLGLNYGNVIMDYINNKVISSIDNVIVAFDFVQDKILNLPKSENNCANDMISWITADSSSKNVYFCDESGGVASFNYQSKIRSIRHFHNKKTWRYLGIKKGCIKQCHTV